MQRSFYMILTKIKAYQSPFEIYLSLLIYCLILIGIILSSHFDVILNYFYFKFHHFTSLIQLANH